MKPSKKKFSQNLPDDNDALAKIAKCKNSDFDLFVWKPDKMTENQVATQVVDAAYKIHKEIGPGLLESAYEAILCHELKKRGLIVARQQPVPIKYDGVELEIGYRADLIVEDKVIVELKSIEKVAPVHKKQLLTYLKLAGKRLGLLINFGEALIKTGITRVANNLPE